MSTNRADLLEIVRLRLVICRAAASDSLRWWDDNALTADGEFVLGRLFPRSANAAARRLAIEAARLRHAAAFEGLGRPCHLFDFGADLEADLEEIPLDEAEMPAGAMPTPARLLEAIGNSASKPTARREGSVVWVEADQSETPLQQAVALASSYATATAGEPLFPALSASGREP